MLLWAVSHYENATGYFSWEVRHIRVRTTQNSCFATCLTSSASSNVIPFRVVRILSTFGFNDAETEFYKKNSYLNNLEF